MRRAARLLALLLPAAAPAAAQDWQGATAAFFGVSLLDTSPEGELQGARADEAARVEMLEAQLADGLRAQGIDLVPLDPVAETLALYANPADCSGCDVRMAAELAADFAVTSEVQKVSNLILSTRSRSAATPTRAGAAACATCSRTPSSRNDGHPRSGRSGPACGSQDIR